MKINGNPRCAKPAARKLHHRKMKTGAVLVQKRFPKKGSAASFGSFPGKLPVKVHSPNLPQNLPEPSDHSQCLANLKRAYGENERQFSNAVPRNRSALSSAEAVVCKSGVRIPGLVDRCAGLRSDFGFRSNQRFTRDFGAALDFEVVGFISCRFTDGF